MKNKLVCFGPVILLVAFFSVLFLNSPVLAQTAEAETGCPAGSADCAGEPGEDALVVVVEENPTTEYSVDVSSNLPPAEAANYRRIPLLAPPDGPPTLVLSVPESGPWSVFGAEALLGAELALKALGSNLEIKTIDEAGQDFANSLWALGSPVAVVGHLYEPTLARAVPYYIKSGSPVILPYLDSPDTDQLGGSFVRLLPDPSVQGRRLAMEVPRSGKRVRNVYILEGSDPPQSQLAEAFREHLLNPKAPEPTKANPRPSKPRAMKASVVHTLKINNVDDLKAIDEIKSTPQDWILLALSPRMAMRAAPYLGSSSLKRATFLAPLSLSVREIGAAYLAVDIRSLMMTLPLTDGAGKNANKKLAEFRRLFVQRYLREPSWAAVMAYDAVSLAGRGLTEEEGLVARLADSESVIDAVSGQMTLSPEGWPTSVYKLDANRLHWLP
ncbi:MAG: hypothetical protein LBJ64_09725 [Deltaproteobacteria bacterium]|jgi:ABC-type branched-subunit amino acid transport system substrate-binding protein|nr:hypothetical protein [Deltaproteobacteria bacterium]